MILSCLVCLHYMNIARKTAVQLGLHTGVGPRVIVSAFSMLPRGWELYLNAVRKAAPKLNDVQMRWIRSQVGMPSMKMCDMYGIRYEAFHNCLFDEFEKHKPKPSELTENTLLRLEAVHDCQISVLSPIIGFTSYWWEIPTIFERSLDDIQYGGRDVLVSSSLNELLGSSNMVPHRFAVLRDSPFKSEGLTTLYRGAGATAILPNLAHLEDRLWHECISDVNPTH